MTTTEKIARLVAERGWNQLEFARAAGLNRNTARQIMLRPEKKLRNQTLRQCADALGLPVNDIVDLPIDRLLLRVHAEPESSNDVYQRTGLDWATQPELKTWMERNPQRAQTLSHDEIDELLSLQGVGGPLTTYGVDQFVAAIERKRELKNRVDAIAGTEFIDLLEQFVNLIYEKIQPYRDG